METGQSGEERWSEGKELQPERMFLGTHNTGGKSICDQCKKKRHQEEANLEGGLIWRNSGADQASKGRWEEPATKQMKREELKGRSKIS